MNVWTKFHPTVVETSHLVSDEKSADHLMIHPQGTLNVCIRFDGKPPNSCEDISLEAENVNQL